MLYLPSVRITLSVPCIFVLWLYVSSLFRPATFARPKIRPSIGVLELPNVNARFAAISSKPSHGRVFTRAVRHSGNFVTRCQLARPSLALAISPIYFAAARFVRDKSRNRPNRLSLFTPSFLRDIHPAVHRWKFSFCQVIVDQVVVSRTAELAISRVASHISVIAQQFWNLIKTTRFRLHENNDFGERSKIVAGSRSHEKNSFAERSKIF